MQIKDVFGIFSSKPVKLLLNKCDYNTLIKVVKDSIELCESYKNNQDILIMNLKVIQNVLEKSVCNDESDLEKEPIVLIDNPPLHFGSGHLSDSAAKHVLGETATGSHSADDSCIQTNIVK